MRIEEHEEALKEHVENIKRLIEGGVEKNQRNIGFNVSQGSVELFSVFLHRLHLIESSGEQLDHRIFKSKNLVEQKLPREFPNKNKILGIMKEIELERIALCYGSRKSKERIERAIMNFHRLRKILGGKC